MSNVNEWAARLAATLPPFTPEEAAAAGRLAASLDARRAARRDEDINDRWAENLRRWEANHREP